MLEKNRINQSLNKNLEGSNDYPTIKLSAPGHEPKRERQKFEKNATSKISPLPRDKKSSDSNSQSALESSGDHQSKLQKFGIKVLPMSINPKLGDVGGKKLKDQPRPAMLLENEINPQKEKSEKPEKPKQANESSRSTSPLDDSLKTKPTGTDELDNGKENVKAILTKGFQNLKEKINQNTLGKKKSKDSTTIQSAVVEEESGAKKAEPKNERVISTKESPKDKNAPTGIPEGECPVPKRRSSVTSGPKVYEKNKQNISVPEEVSRAGDVARNSRKSINDPNSSRKSGTSLNSEAEVENQLNLDLKDKIKEKKVENYSDSDHSIDGDSLKTSDEAKRPKRSKGKAPAPPGPDLPKDDRPSASPKQIFTSEINEITKDVEVKRNKKPNDLESETSETKIIELKKENKKEEDRHHLPSYDSDSDTESRNVSSKDRPNNTKIELNATQVTVHQSSSGDGNDDDVEPSRKAASLGDLSKLDSDQPLSIVLERAVSLDLADGSSQGSKKRKAPLPPSEEFPAAFDDLNYRKEPRLEHGLGLNTFQRRLKKSSDFGTLEDALSDGPKSLEIEVNKRSSPIDLTEAHNTNIQEFSSWLAECRRPKSSYSETSGEETAASRISSTSLVNINASEDFDKEDENDNRPQYEYQGSNVSFSVNGKNFPDFDKVSEEERAPNFPGVNSRTVVVISQPSSLEPTIVETVPINYSKDEKSQNTLSKDSEDYDIYSSALSEECTSLDPYVTSSESRLESFHKEAKPDDYDSPPKLPSSPMPVMTTSSTLSSPLSSSLTYITEIKVSTAQKEGNKESMTTEPPKSTKPSGNGPTDRYELDSGELITSTPRPETVNSISKRIQQFDTKQSLPKPFISPIRTKPGFGYVDGKSVNSPSRKENNMIFEPSKIPIKTMKSETGQKVLATIQSLATKEASPPKIPEMEYAKRMASLFSGNSLERNQVNLRRQLSTSESTETGQPNISGFYLKGPEMSPTKSSKDFYPGRKIPPTVPPRKMETSLSSTSSVKVELTGNNHESPLTSSQAGMSGKLSPVNTQERNIVTFSSFMPKKPSEESTNSTLISFKIK